MLSKFSNSTMHAAIGIPWAPVERPVVVVIDFSNAFTRGTSQFPGGDFSAELESTHRLLTGAREWGVPIFYTTIAYADPERNSGFWGKKVPWLSRCKLGSEAVAIDTVLGPRADEPVIVKRFPSAFFETDLHCAFKASGPIRSSSPAAQQAFACARPRLMPCNTAITH